MTEYYFFFFNDTATTEIYTLSLHDALPIPRGLVHGVGLPDPGRPEHADRHRDRRQRVEPLHELRQDPHHPPRVLVHEVRHLPLQQRLILGGPPGPPLHHPPPPHASLAELIRHARKDARPRREPRPGRVSSYRGTRARTLAGLPLPRTIFRGATTRIEPVGGSWDRFASWVRPYLLAPSM